MKLKYSVMNKAIEDNFINPPKEFSPLPFWFWNDTFDEKEIIRQIQEMNDKGVNGFIIHPRIGIPHEIPYMSETFLNYVECAVKEAHRLGMQVILYDEGMYPSGSAHGMVVEKNPEFATRGLRLEESLSSKPSLEKDEKLICTLIAEKTGEKSLCPDSICEYVDGELAENYVFLHLIEGFTYGHIRGIHIGEDDWESPPRSADILNPESVAVFMELTHERYYKRLSKYFGNTVIGIFTDEPCVSGREGDARMCAWTIGFADRLKNNGISLSMLPALWYDLGEETVAIRKNYRTVVKEQLTESFYKQISDWCSAHNIALVGHPAHSGDIGLLDYFHIPAQDLIFRRVAPENELGLVGIESTQAKCSSDAARHHNRRRNANECFACSGKNGVEWAFNADDMKWMMDWLFVRGVNMLVPHAFFYSLDGERRFGERPPDVGQNNIWWKYYDTISDYIKRMSYMMTDSVNVTSTAVLCEADFLPYEVAKPLYENQLEFNYLEEALINNGKCSIEDGKLCIASQCYTTLIIENAKLLSDKIVRFASEGGKVIVLNPAGYDIPKGVISVDKAEKLVDLMEKDLSILPANKDLRVSHVIKDGEHFYVLSNEGERCIEGNISVLAGEKIYVMDPWKGEINLYNNEKLVLNRRETVILCTGEAPSVRTEIIFGEELGKLSEEIQLTEWSIDSVKTDLGSWTEIPHMNNFCGTVIYDTDFEINVSDGRRIFLDMGQVGEQAEVYINGTYAGFRLWAPYMLELTQYIKNGKNSLSIAVTNSLANKYTDKLQPSGLLSEVTLKLI